MGSLFRSPRLSSQSVLSSQQQTLLDPLSQFIQEQLSKPNTTGARLSRDLFRSTTTQAQNQSERIFREALLSPALRAFDEEIAPRISAGFAGVGGTLSTRRGETLSRALGDVRRSTESELARLLPVIQSFPLQQTLSQIQGFQGLESLKFAPYDRALAFALQPTQSVGTSPAGPGWGLLGTALGAASFGLSSRLFSDTKSK